MFKLLLVVDIGFYEGCYDIEIIVYGKKFEKCISKYFNRYWYKSLLL